MRTFGGCQFVHFGGVVEVAGDDDLGGIVLAGGGLWHDVVGRPLVMGGFSRRVQFECRVEWSWRRWLVLGFRVRGYFGFHQVLWAPCSRSPEWPAAAVVD